MADKPPKQRTLAQPASLKGNSLHTGETVTLTLKPAPCGHGIQFQRIDLEDQPLIAAHVSKVQTVERATTLAEGSVKVQTVEHVLSALTGMGIDNALVEMDANEPPIGDGSAAPYLQCIQQAGIVEQDEPLSVWEIREPIHLESRNGSLFTIVPDKKFRISCTQADDQGNFTQFFSTEITPAIYEKEIAPARTFVHYEDVKPLLDKGLIKGGSLESAIVIKGDSIMASEPLRFDDEFVRHKILDIVGDLMLCGKRIMGHIIAVRPGHGPNTEMAKKVAKEYAVMRAMVPPVQIPTGESVLDINEILKILPHRYPFLLVDRIVKFEGEWKCTGIKNVTMNEPFFPGHFPGHPVMPGVLQVEAMAQVGSILMLRQEGNQGKIGYFMSADKVKFRKPVLPGDTLFIEAEVTKARGSVGQTYCRCLVNDKVVSEGELKFGLVEQ
ncbi:MAG: bifunctional UDP-3-O-[3-hydroxymyristoyl] N-acetylglucosamine deacetylase/3-hydroxyacyl-ACP dehydratase [Verrucomicrobiota bacterium]